MEIIPFTIASKKKKNQQPAAPFQELSHCVYCACDPGPDQSPSYKDSDS
jgi:hypothetical protein